MSEIPDFVKTDLEALSLEIPLVLLEKLRDYLDFLLLTNQQFNLIAPTELEAAWRRHIIDSLTATPGLDSLPEHARVADVGAGGGLPGIPLAICRPDLEFTLIDATTKKCVFLQNCVDTLGLENVTILQGRTETLAHEEKYRQQYDAICCRAVGPMRVLLELTLPLIKVGGFLLAIKGPKAEQELEQASDALDILGAGEIRVFEAYPESFDIHTVIVVVDKAESTPTDYPRRPGIPKYEPL